jgi:hypothetical protein
MSGTDVGGVANYDGSVSIKMVLPVTLKKYDHKVVWFKNKN